MFKLSENFISQYRGKQPEWGFGDLSYFVYKDKYARMKPDGASEEFWETCQRVIEGVFNIQFKHCRQMGLQWNANKAQATAQKMFVRMWQMKFLPPGRGLWLMGTPIIEQIGSAGLNNPLHEDTKILTKEHGWITLKEIEGQEVTVLSNTKLYGRDNSTSANPVWAKATISHAEEHPCLKIEYQDREGNTFSVISSENHRWFRKHTSKHEWERVEATRLRVGDYMPKTKPMALNFNLCPTGIQHGYFFGDGTKRNGELHQFGDEDISILRSLFTNVEDAQPVNESTTHAVVRHLPLAWGKIPSPEYESDRRYMLGFLAGYVAADGSVNDSAIKISSANRSNLEEVKRIAKNLGIATGDIKLISTSSNYKEERELYEVTLNRYDLNESFFVKPSHKIKYIKMRSKSTCDTLRITNISKLDGLHRVLCATVPDYEQFVTEGFVLTSNCGFISTSDIGSDFSMPFCWTAEMLMLGVGIGFDTKGAGKALIHKPSASLDPVTLVIPDSREGWVDALRQLLNSYAKPGLPRVEFDYSLVRPAGQPIKGFGGVASGPAPLKEGLESIRTLLNGFDQKTLTSVAITDLMNYIGKFVVSGNVRRSAEIAIGELGDRDFIDMKNPEKFAAELNDRRWASNNSVFVTPESNFDDIINGIARNGEPGLILLQNARHYGRFKDGRNPANSSKYDDVDGFNPSLRAGTLVLTKEGIKPIEQLDGRDDIYVRNFRGEWQPAKAFKSGKNKTLYRIRFNSGYEVFCTPEHKWPLLKKNTNAKRDDVENVDYSSFDKSRTDELRGGEYVFAPANTRPLHDNKSDNDLTEDDAFWLGWWHGDGWVSYRNKEDRFQIGYIVNDQDGDNVKNRLSNYINKITQHKVLGCRRGSSIEYNLSSHHLVEKTRMMNDSLDKYSLPKMIWSQNNDFIASFVDGLFSSDGCISQSNGVWTLQLTSKSKQLISDIRRLLMFYGIQGRIKHTTTTLDGYDKTYHRYDLSITGHNIVRFENAFSFTHEAKNAKLSLATRDIMTNSQRYRNEYLRIMSVEKTDLVEDVYDITVQDDTHTFLMETGVTGNCAEQGLKHGELCCVSKDTRILTKDGYPTIESVVGKSVEVWNGKSWSRVTPFLAAKNKELYRVHLSDGSYLDATEDHKWSVLRGRAFKQLETKDMTVGDRLESFELQPINDGIREENAYQYGWVAGDGFIDGNKVMAVVQEPEYAILSSLGGAPYKEQHPDGYSRPFRRVNLSALVDFEAAKSLRNDRLPEVVFSWDAQSIAEFMGGWIDTDGCLRSNQNTDHYVLHGSEKKLRDAQLLLRRIGVNHASLRLERKAGTVTNLGVSTQDLWVLLIPSYECSKITTRLKVAQRFGPSYARNNAHLDGLLIDRARKQRIVKIEKLDGLHDTFCFSEPVRHMGVFGNVLTYQCLVETFPANHDSVEDYYETLKVAFLYAKSVTLVPTHHPLTNQVMLTNRRIGLSMSGVQQALKKFGFAPFFEEFCDLGYEKVRHWDRIYSRWLGIPTSIKVTTIKPSGTVSLLAGATPGVHCTHSPFYFRTFRIGALSPLIEKLLRANYRLEFAVTDAPKLIAAGWLKEWGDTLTMEEFAKDAPNAALKEYGKLGGKLVAYFPVKEKNFTKSKFDISLWEQLCLARELQDKWSDNSVSITVTFKPHEGKDIKSAIEYMAPYLKTLSFLPLEDHSYAQAPYQAITEEQYEAYASNLKKLRLNTIKGLEARGDKFCNNDVCEI